MNKLLKMTSIILFLFPIFGCDTVEEPCYNIEQTQEEEFKKFDFWLDDSIIWNVTYVYKRTPTRQMPQPNVQLGDGNTVTEWITYNPMETWIVYNLVDSLDECGDF